MPVCKNCGNDSRFALSIECTVVVADASVTSPEWAATLACADCQSTHVT